MNAILLELGFLQRLREDPLWAAGRLDLRHVGRRAGGHDGGARPARRPRGVRARPRAGGDVPAEPALAAPLNGLHDYTLPETIAERLAPVERAGARGRPRRRSSSSCDVTDVTDGELDERHAFERTTRAAIDAARRDGRAVLASAAISALVLPLRVGEMIGTDGGWVRNFPLGHAYDNPDVERDRRLPLRLPRHPRSSGENLVAAAAPARAVPRRAAGAGADRRARGGRGARRSEASPRTSPEMIVRLMRVTIARNTALEERSRRRAGRLRRRAGGAPRGRARDRVPRSAAPWRRRRAPRSGRGAVRRRALPFPPRPRAAADDRPRRPRRACARPDASAPGSNGPWRTKRALDRARLRATDEALARSGEQPERDRRRLAAAACRGERPSSLCGPWAGRRTPAVGL